MDRLKKNTHANVASYFIAAMLIVIIGLQVVWPVVDEAINTNLSDDPENETITPIDNMSTSSQSLVNMIPLFLVLAIVMFFIKPLI